MAGDVDYILRVVVPDMAACPVLQAVGQDDPAQERYVEICHGADQVHDGFRPQIDRPLQACQELKSSGCSASTRGRAQIARCRRMASAAASSSRLSMAAMMARC